MKVSSGSNLVSPLTRTVTVWLVWPGAKVSVPLVGGVVAVGAVAVPSAVA